MSLVSPEPKSFLPRHGLSTEYVDAKAHPGRMAGYSPINGPRLAQFAARGKRRVVPGDRAAGYSDGQGSSRFSGATPGLYQREPSPVSSTL